MPTSWRDPNILFHLDRLAPICQVIMERAGPDWSVRIEHRAGGAAEGRAARLLDAAAAALNQAEQRGWCALPDEAK